MQLRFLATFLAVARHRNFTRAAEEVHLAQSSVSDQIQLLEANLGAGLFLRSRGGLELTPAGEMLKDYAEQLMDLADEARAAVSEAAGQETGTITIGALETISSAVLPDLLAKFRKQNPAINVRLKVAGTGELLQKLGTGYLDAVFCFGRGRLEPRFAGRSISKDPLVLIGSPNRSGQAGPVALTAEGFIATEPGCVYRAMFDDAFAAMVDGGPVVSAEVGSMAAIIGMVAADAGLALVPRLAAAKAIGRGEVAELAWPGVPTEAELIMVWRRRRVQPPALKVLLAAVGEHIAPVKSADGLLRRAEQCPS